VRSGRVPPLPADHDQRDYLVQQLTRALGRGWVERNSGLVDAYLEAVAMLGYSLPDEHGSTREAA
jgi:hypothetical protein